MSTTLATYSFLPWLRQGIANSITTADKNDAVKLRASVKISVTVAGTKTDGSAIAPTPVEQQIILYGPGDITGIDAGAIVKTEPRNWITNFESNYLPYIDFYEEDFPWRYTPAAHNTNRLRPWIMLVVLKEDEFDEGAKTKKAPLPWFRLKEGKSTADIFPDPQELWAWAHVHVNADLSDNAAPNTAAPSDVTNLISGIIDQAPDLAYSRILCPRRLEANAGYHAFLIPVFESGRLAGLGRTIDPGLMATACGWDNDANTEFPYYHRWYFRTGNVGDFEYLVNLLQPKLADKTVGVRDMDVRHPGSNLPPVNNPELNGILKLGGALKVPFDTLKEEDKKEIQKFDEWDEHPYPHEFTKAIAARINLADDYANSTKPIEELNKATGIVLKNDSSNGDPDPVITSPLYGRWHALQQRLLKDSRNADLPNNKNWIHELNLDPRFRVAAGFGTKVVQKNQEEYMQAAWEQVGKIIEANSKIRFSQLATAISVRLYEKVLVPLANEKKLVLTAPLHSKIVSNQLTVKAQLQSSIIPTSFASGKFRSITSPGSAFIKKLSVNSPVNALKLAEAVNEGKLKAVPLKQDPAKAIKLPKSIIAPFEKKMWDIDVYPKTSNFSFTISGNISKAKKIRVATKDNAEAAAFKAALKDVYDLVNTSFKETTRTKLDLATVNKNIIAAINPAVTIRKRTFDLLSLPGRIKDNQVETFAPVMAYPEIDLPMYKPLADISSELFLPNLDKIEQNSITLLENNQKFIEAYMVGINHEMSRELLWREYPTDQRGTCFRQFWDVSGFLETGQPAADIKEQLRDIIPIHQWTKKDERLINPNNPSPLKRNDLGSHNKRSNDGKAQLVLVIRGELLKKYPTAVIYAHKAAWNGGVDQPRILTTIAEDNPPATKLKTPLFEAKIEPDIYFFGFDLTAEQARGKQDPAKISDDPGWFFVIKERPGEPRFGFDLDKKEEILSWNDLSWEDTGTEAGKHIEIPPGTGISAPPVGSTNADDAQANWDSGIDSAELAYILYQAPVMVAVHASRMLP